MAQTHPQTDMLRCYAAGTLPPGLSLLVATHLTFCRCCRDKVAGVTALCGALLAGADPVPPSGVCLSQTLARLDTPAPEPGPPSGLPRPLCRRVGGPVAALPWVTVDAGVAEASVPGFSPEYVALVRAQPGARLRGTSDAALLVLSGGLVGPALCYGPGDMAPDQGEAAEPEPCLCLRVRPDARGS